MSSWSTRELADLAGTTLRAVRYYHEIGLLPEPERAANGYKAYGVQHLLRVTRIRRLTELGVPLPQIAALGEADDRLREALRALDAALAHSIDNQQRVRDEVAVMLEQDLTIDLPPELAAADGLASPTRALMVVYGRVLDQPGREALSRFLTLARSEPVDAELDAVEVDADEGTREDLARRLTPRIHALLTEHREVLGSQLAPPDRAAGVRHAISLATAKLYNSAQRDVLSRISRGLHQMDQQSPGPPSAFASRYSATAADSSS